VRSLLAFGHRIGYLAFDVGQCAESGGVDGPQPLGVQLDLRRSVGQQLAHDLGHEQTYRTLPGNIRMAYDGLTIPIRVGQPTA